MHTWNRTPVVQLLALLSHCLCWKFSFYGLHCSLGGKYLLFPSMFVCLYFSGYSTYVTGGGVSVPTGSLNLHDRVVTVPMG